MALVSEKDRSKMTADDGNSPFARTFLKALSNNTDAIDGTRLFAEIWRPVILHAKQTPEYSDVRD